MAWTIEFSDSASRQLHKLHAQHRQCIFNLLAYLPTLDDPRLLGEGLDGLRISQPWKYRWGDNRLICQILDDDGGLTRIAKFGRVRVLAIGHRKEIYR